MKPTPTQIEAAARRLTELEGLNPDADSSDFHDGLIWEEYKDSAEAILCAALSVPAVAVVGEPVAWTDQTEIDNVRENGSGLVWRGDDTAISRGRPIPLYAAPSAPDDETECEFGVPEPKFRVGQLVEKASGYKWPGVVVSRFLTQSLQIRYVVECTVPEVAGALHIYSESQLAALRSEKP
ncbi:hypothetical protein N182_18335 [Sinorhizobium sp. GL2]|nr:hypothetical protein N182_18335 [Sinorhizobium sp. GL2]